MTQEFIENLILAGIIKAEDALNENNKELKHYMFFSNLHTIKEKVDKLLTMNRTEIDKLLDNGHDWASDHISTSKDDVEEVYNFISSSLAGNR